MGGVCPPTCPPPERYLSQVGKYADPSSAHRGSACPRKAFLSPRPAASARVARIEALRAPRPGAEGTYRVRREGAPKWVSRVRRNEDGVDPAAATASAAGGGVPAAAPGRPSRVPRRSSSRRQRSVRGIRLAASARQRGLFRRGFTPLEAAVRRVAREMRLSRNAVQRYLEGAEPGVHRRVMSACAVVESRPL